MNEDDFWKLIEDCRARSDGDFAQQVQLQRTRLLALSLDELVTFGNLWDAVEDRAFTWPVWDVAALLLGGCGDDSFSDFRAWLIGQGRQMFAQVVDNPDSLADVAPAWTDSTGLHAETYGSQVFSVYEERTGSCDWPEPEFTAPSGGPTGESVNLADEHTARAHFPRMAERYYGQAPHPR